MSLIDHSWEVCSEPANDSWVAGRTIGVAGYGGRRICDVTSYMCDEEAKPVADLIAAAPDLLVALKELMAAVAASNTPPETVTEAERELDAIRNAGAKARAAIAKAES